MPQSPSFHKSALTLTREQLKERSQDYHMGFSGTRLPRIRVGTKMQTLLDLIYKQFLDYSEAKVSVLPAEMFGEIIGGFSNSTINKAKKFLGIRSKRKNGKWWWTFPQRAPNEALNQLHKQMIEEADPFTEIIQELKRPAATELEAIMIENNYVVSNKKAIAAMSAASYTRRTTLRMKALLGIVSRKIEEDWVWFWPNKDVQDWLNDKLTSGPVEVSKIYEMAWEEKQWSNELLIMARKIMGNITFSSVKGKIALKDINRDETERPGDKIIDVDFSGVIPPVRKTEVIPGVAIETYYTEEEDEKE